MSFTCNSRCKVILMLTALVIVCVGGGGWIGFSLGRKHERGRNQTVAWNQEVMSTLHRKLNPSPEQEQRFQAAVDRAVTAMQIERNAAIKNADVIVQKFIAELQSEVREDQRAELERLAKNRGKATLDLLKVKKQSGK